MGVAMLAASEVSGRDVFGIADTWIKTAEVINPRDIRKYDEKFLTYRDLYKTLSGVNVI